MTKKKHSKTTSKKGKHDESVMKVPKKNYYVWPIVAVFMTIIFLAVVFNKPVCNSEGQNKVTMEAVNSDELIFVNSDGCTQACEEMQPVAKEVASKTGLEFREITTPQKVQVPGYMIIKDKETKSLLRPIQDKASFYNQVCSVVDNSQICSEAEKLAQEAQQAQQQKQEKNLESIPKEDKPKVDLYVMSFCPYGNKAENTIEPVYKLLKDEVDFNVNYIVSEKGGEIKSLHGTKEVEQDKREVCVLEHYSKDKFFKFITYVNDNCGSKGDCWQEAANEAGIDTEKISSCAEERGKELLKQEAQKAKEAGASGSPTMLINGQKTDMVYNYGQPSSYQKAVCAGFTEEPAACDENLESASTQAPTQASGGSC